MFWIGVAIGSLSTLMLVVVYSACVVSGRISQKEEAMASVLWEAPRFSGESRHKTSRAEAPDFRRGRKRDAD